MMEIKPMTKERLEQYRSYRQEIKELEYKLVRPDEETTFFGNDVIMDYKTGFPRPQSVVGFDNKKYGRFKERSKKRLEFLYGECAEIEKYVDTIITSRTRRIFQLYFIDGDKKVSQKDVAKKIPIDRSRVSREIDKYLKNAHKAHKAHV